MFSFFFSIFQPISPLHSLPLIHGKAGVSHLCFHNNTIYSSGRDGVYRQVRVHNNALEVIDTKKVLKLGKIMVCPSCCPPPSTPKATSFSNIQSLTNPSLFQQELEPHQTTWGLNLEVKGLNFYFLSLFYQVFKGFDWLERLIFTTNGHLLIAGFHAVSRNQNYVLYCSRQVECMELMLFFSSLTQAYFVLWSVQRNELLWKVQCGGAHRVWDLAIQQSVNNIYHFVDYCWLLQLLLCRDFHVFGSTL